MGRRSLCEFNTVFDSIFAMQSASRHSTRGALSGGALLVTVGVLHSMLVLRRLRPPPLQRELLLLGAALMILAGVSHLIGSLADDASVRRMTGASALAAGVAGLVLSLGLMYEAPAAPQALPQLFVFGVAVAFTVNHYAL